MSKTFRAFPAANIVALFTEAAGGGATDDINSPCNRPALDPEAWLSSVFFHSSLNYLEVAFDVFFTAAHGSIAIASGLPGGEIATAKEVDANGSQIDWEALSHNLGYEPLVLVAVGTNLLVPGHPVQVPVSTNGSARFVTPYVTSTKVFLHEFQGRGAAALPGQDITYRIIVFRQPPAPSGNQLVNFDPATGVLKLARGKFDSSRRYLQVVPGGSPLGFAIGRTMDAKNGAYRIARPDGTTYDPIPSGVKHGIYASGAQFGPGDTLVYGSDILYDGTFAGSAAAQVQVP